AEIWFMAGPYFLAGAWAAGAAAGAAVAARGAATVTLSPSFRKPAPATTTRAPASTPSTEVWSSRRDNTVTGVKRTEESAFSTNTPDLLLRYRTASVGTTVAGRAPASMAARANMPGFSALPDDRLMRASPRRV